MNEQTRSELEQLKQHQAKLTLELATLSARLRQLENRLEHSEVATQSPREIPKTAPAVAPILPRPAESKPSAVPPIITTPAPGVSAESRPLAAGSPPASIPLKSEPPRPAPPPVSATAPVPEKRSFEMRLGTYWLVRVGIVMLLTGLVFFGNYAYQNFIGRLGPAGKVSLLYVASAALLGFGAWWQRKAARDALRNYGQVLFAGGLAAVYFTTYAAHHIPNLRIISSPLVDGALLLAWAAFMVWIADRRRSEVLALFAVGLAYYTSVITRVGSFTLYSNVILTAAAVFFLVRNRWAVLSIASLVATYGSYAFWRFYDGSGWRWASPDEGLWFGAYFLMSYWCLFTAAVFLSKVDSLSRNGRAGFLTFNNVAFFALFLLTMFQVRHGGFWKFSIIYGSALTGLALLARRQFNEEPLIRNSYLTQGLLLVTVGIIAKFTGLQLALLLGVESVILLTLGMARSNPILQTGSYLAGAMAIGWSIDGLERDNWRTLLLESALSAMMLFNAFWASRYQRNNRALIRPVPAFFCVLALIGGFAGIACNCSSIEMPVALALTGFVVTLSVYLLRLRELSMFAQIYILAAQLLWLIRAVEPERTWPWWNPLTVIAVSVLLSHWWQRQKMIELDINLSRVVQALYGIAFVTVVGFWLQPQLQSANWLMLSAALAVALTVYAVLMRAWILGLCSQLFLAVSVIQFALHPSPGWHQPLAPILALAVLSIGTVVWLKRAPNATAAGTWLNLARAYRWIAVLMLLFWVERHIPMRERMWTCALLGLAGFLIGGWRKNQEVLLIGAFFTVAGLAFFWSPFHDDTPVYWPNLIALLALLGQQRIARRVPQRYELDNRVHAAAILLGGISLWFLLSRWVSLHAGGFYLTASWSVFALALFVFGMAFRERQYRWLGLGVLACALGRVVIFDVWKLETIYRILSFMALGIVLLVLGFIYNKYQEKIREWL